MVQNDINKAIALVTNNIIRAADIAIPKITGYPTRHCRLWWNDEYKLTRKKQQKEWGSLESILQKKITLLTNRLGHMQQKSAESLGSAKSQA